MWVWVVRYIGSDKAIADLPFFQSGNVSIRHIL